jgi:flagellum-specific ATP synthase
MNEPIADAVRSILDGHVVLSRHLAHAGHYPAVDVLQSVSRLIGEVVSPEVRSAGMRLRKLLAAYRDKEDLIAIGAYQQGTDPVVDEAVAKRLPIDAFLQQTIDDVSTAELADAQLLALAGEQPAAFDMDGPVVEQPPMAAVGESAIPPLHLSV